MKIAFIIFVIAVSLLIILNWISKRSVVKISTVYAGNVEATVPTKVTCRLLSSSLNLFVDNEKIDISKFEVLLVKGTSLSSFGFKNNSMIFCSLWDNKKQLSSIRGRFIILNLDNDKYYEQDPYGYKHCLPDGKKLRKVLSIVNFSMNNKELEDITKFAITNLEDEVYDDAKKNQLTVKIKENYKFARKYYRNKRGDNLVMAVSYINDSENEGIISNFAFYTPDDIYGVVEYVSSDMLNNFEH